MNPTLLSDPEPHTAFLQPEDGVFELPGKPPAWIWVCTCPDPDCDCRMAFVLATHDGRDALLERIAPVYAAWSRSGGHFRAEAADIDTLIGFEIDIDDAVVYDLHGDANAVLDLAAHPAIADVVARIRGPELDQFDALWHHGKGLPAAEDSPPELGLLDEFDLQIDELWAWTDVCDPRSDVYLLGEQRYLRYDLYCMQPHCHCDEVVIAFEDSDPGHGNEPGSVVVQLKGKAELQPGRAGDVRLAQLWAAFQQRYPDYLTLLKERNRSMKELGATLLPGPVRVLPKPGRNDPCSCGSGKKYKKCCGSN